MKKEELEELFCIKINLELKRFKESMLLKEPEEIYGNAYQIDSIINFAELLFAMRQKISVETLEKLLLFPNLLAFVYDRWLDMEDSHVEELTDCLERCVKEVENMHKEKQGAA